MVWINVQSVATGSELSTYLLPGWLVEQIYSATIYQQNAQIEFINVNSYANFNVMIYFCQNSQSKPNDNVEWGNKNTLVSNYLENEAKGFRCSGFFENRASCSTLFRTLIVMIGLVRLFSKSRSFNLRNRLFNDLNLSVSDNDITRHGEASI